MYGTQIWIIWNTGGVGINTCTHITNIPASSVTEALLVWNLTKVILRKVAQQYLHPVCHIQKAWCVRIVRPGTHTAWGALHSCIYAVACTLKTLSCHHSLAPLHQHWLQSVLTHLHPIISTLFHKQNTKKCMQKRSCEQFDGGRINMLVWLSDCIWKPLICMYVPIPHSSTHTCTYVHAHLHTQCRPTNLHEGPLQVHPVLEAGISHDTPLLHGSLDTL